MKQTIMQIILENQRLIGRESYYHRNISIERIPHKATVLVGVRRSGKSVYQELCMQELLSEGVDRRNICYLDFSDDRLIYLRTAEPDVIADAYYSLFPEKSDEKVYFFFDEFQYVNNWPLFANRLLRTRPCEVYITGSSAKLLSKEIGTEFAGRSLTWEFFPYSFEEYVSIKTDNQHFPDRDHLTPDDGRSLLKLYDSYAETGGFPEVMMMENPRTKRMYLQNLAKDVVLKDVIQRFNLENPQEAERIMNLLIQRMSDRFTYRKLYGILKSEQYSSSALMVQTITSFLNDAYLVFPIEILTMKDAQRRSNPKKCYLVDHSVHTAVSQSLTPDYGKILENIIFMHIRKYTDRIYYAVTEEGKEVDFACLPAGTDGIEDVRLVQVCYEPAEDHTWKREVDGIRSAMREYKRDTGIIVTYNTKKEEETDEGTILYIPAYEYLRIDPFSIV